MRRFALTAGATLWLVGGLLACGSQDSGAQVLPTVTTPGPSTQAGLPSSLGVTSAPLEPGPGSESTTGAADAALPGSTGATGTQSSSVSSGSTSSSPQASSSDQSSSSQETSQGSGSMAQGSTDAGGTASDPKTPEPKSRVRWTKGHGDVRINWDEGTQSLVPKIVISDDGIIDGKPVPDGQELVFDPAEVSVVLSHRIERGSAQGAAQFDPLCIPVGDSMFFVPSTPVKDAAVPFLGIANRIQSSSPVQEQHTTLAFRGIAGPSKEPVQFSLWQIQSTGITFFASSCDGFDQQDEMNLSWGHDHFDMGFAGPAGAWALSMQARSQLSDGSTTQVDFQVHFEFVDPQ